MNKFANRRIKNLPQGTEVYYGFCVLGTVGVDIDKRLENLCVLTEIPGCESGTCQILVTNNNRELVHKIYNEIKARDEEEEYERSCQFPEQFKEV